jgi:hypothetical protein
MAGKLLKEDLSSGLQAVIEAGGVGNIDPITAAGMTIENMLFGTGAGGTTFMGDTSNLNDITRSGFYFVNDAANSPVTSGGLLHFSNPNSADIAIQAFFNLSNGDMYTRVKNGASYTAWAQRLYTGV